MVPQVVASRLCCGSLEIERVCACVDEPARQIISEQRAIGGSGVSDKVPPQFIELVLSRAITMYHDIQDTSDEAIFYLGNGDNIACAALQNLPFNHSWRLLIYLSQTQKPGSSLSSTSALETY